MGILQDTKVSFNLVKGSGQQWSPLPQKKYDLRARDLGLIKLKAKLLEPLMGTQKLFSENISQNTAY